MLVTNTSWDLEADVVVVGHGGAGPVAAITAQEEGADVLIVEKQPQQSHQSNTSMSGGGVLCPSDVKSGVEYLEALCRVGAASSWTAQDMIAVWAEYTADNRAWLAARGGVFEDTPETLVEMPPAAEYPGLPGYQAMARYRFKGSGPGLANYLSETVQKRGVRVAYETRATKLLTNLNGEVVGVEAQSSAGGATKSIRVRASQGVVLACGGFEFDEEMKLHYLRVYPTYFTGTPANTGDGVRMAQGVGADLWHMNCVSAHNIMKFPTFPTAFYAALVPGIWFIPEAGSTAAASAKECGYVVVDRYGTRFANEDLFRATPPRHAYYYELAQFDSQRLVYPRVPSYWIFDQRRMDLGPLPRRSLGAAGPLRLYEWSEDNSREIAAGWISTASTVRDLAGKLDLSPDALEDTVNRYNSICQRHNDSDFGRNPSTLMPLESPPYCAVRLWPGGANTQGGPRRNVKAEVLSADGGPIPGLYSAGELGSLYGMLYPGAGNLAECVAFGRIAGQNAARRKP
ncbi:MAG: FAD-dependent oxidoreductase [Chloroflexota bacterium]